MFPSAFQAVLDELNKRNADRSGEDAKLWEEFQGDKDTMEVLLGNELSCLTQSACAAFLSDGDQARPADLL